MAPQIENGLPSLGDIVLPLQEAVSLQKSVKKADFPEDFIFGTATAAYQVEGAAFKGGRGSSIWDTFSHLPGKVADGSNGDSAVDQYHRFEEDIELMDKIGFDAYRFSVSWPRIFPDGLDGSLNQEGIAHYNAVINALVRKGIKPVVTLYHWDLPQTLHNTIGGWLSPKIVKYFSMYAEACFEAFGDRVKHWITFNEPGHFSVCGYGTGRHAPGRCSDRARSPVGDSSTEPYIAAHNVLLAHAAAADVYNRMFKVKQGGVLGISVSAIWIEPLTSSPEDIDAAERDLEFNVAWFLDPIFFGDYPTSMRMRVGSRLPRFTPNEIAMVQGSLDFVGINNYTTRYVTSAPVQSEEKSSSGFYEDMATTRFFEVCGKPIGGKGASDWMYIVPRGLGNLVTWVTRRYNRPVVYVTENGMDDENCSSKSLQDFLHDTTRVKFYQEYLSSIVSALREGADVRGYFAWSLIDNFEWENGYSKRFGLIFVDYDNNMARHLKDSALWFSTFLRNDLKSTKEHVKILSSEELKYLLSGIMDAQSTPFH